MGKRPNKGNSGNSRNNPHNNRRRRTTRSNVRPVDMEQLQQMLDAKLSCMGSKIDKLSEDLQRHDMRHFVCADIIEQGGTKIINNYHTAAPSPTIADKRKAVQKAIGLTAQRMKMSYKVEFAAIYQVIVEKNIIGRLTRDEFCQMASACRLQLTPTENDLKQLTFADKYPHWRMSNGKDQRYTDIAAAFIEMYHSSIGAAESFVQAI